MDAILMNDALEAMAESFIDQVEICEENGDGPFLTLLKSDVPEITRAAEWTGDLADYEADFKGFERKPIVATDFTAVVSDDKGMSTTLPHQTWSYDAEAEGEDANEVSHVVLVGDLGEGEVVLCAWPLAAAKTFEEDGNLITVAIKHRCQNPPWPEPVEEEP